jgi:hypothetical protein
MYLSEGQCLVVPALHRLNDKTYLMYNAAVWAADRPNLWQATMGWYKALNMVLSAKAALKLPV